MTEPNTADSRDIDTKYAMEVGKILHAAAAATANQSPNGTEVATYAVVVWDGKHYDRWMPEEALADLARILGAWQNDLTQAGFRNWTSMFVGAKSPGGFAWLPSYSPDYEPWRIKADVPNWPTIEQGLQYVS